LENNKQVDNMHFSCHPDFYNFTCSGDGESDGRFCTNTAEIVGKKS
jgi:hypothetical protein